MTLLSCGACGETIPRILLIAAIRNNDLVSSSSLILDSTPNIASDIYLYFWANSADTGSKRTNLRTSAYQC
jgi:hypothetical protein